MKHQKIVHALDRILYLIEKQAVPYQGELFKSKKFHSYCLFVQYYKKTSSI